ncbi:hypothetical protein GCM10023313_06780 [Mucilaginibacter defluvii]|uniref:Uncharacterized protein n=1 Tax=Mucilaginibacter defluvii TaxID=1196019 RepID=A0ABP9FSG7_9SPHI
MRPAVIWADTERENESNITVKIAFTFLQAENTHQFITNTLSGAGQAFMPVSQLLIRDMHLYDVKTQRL